MANVIFQNIAQSDGSILAVAIIDHGNGPFTSMLKTVYDAQQAQAKP